jgi:hypothetical protein
MPLLNNKSTSEVFLALFWYVNIESEVGEPTSLAMLKIMTRLRMPSVTREPIECLSRVLDGTLVACGLRIGKRPHKLQILKTKQRCTHKLLSHFTHLKLAFHKLINGKLCVSWCTCTPGTQEFDALTACGVIVSSPLANKVRSSSILKGWKDYGMIARGPLTLVIGLELHASLSI